MAGDVTAATYRLIVGARGWDHSAWNGAFYPEDLPEDWRLSYYSNEFRGVLLPESVWQTAGPREIASWCDDVADGFLFFLQASDPLAAGPQAETYRVLFGSHWGGVPATAGSVMSADEEWDLRGLRKRLENLMAQPQGVAVPGFFISGSPPDIDHLREVKMLADML